MKKRIKRITVVLLFLPIAVHGVLRMLNRVAFFSVDFWRAYMGFFGTVMVSATALLQSAILEEKTHDFEEKQKKQDAEFERLQEERERIFKEQQHQRDLDFLQAQEERDRKFQSEQFDKSLKIQEQYRKEDSIRRKKEREQDIMLENISTEHPLIKIESVQLFGAFGKKMIEEYVPNEHKENFFVGQKLQGKLLIKIRNIGNGLLLNMTHRGIEGLHGELNSKSIMANKDGDIFLFFDELPQRDQEIIIQYTNIRNYKYEQLLRIVVDERDRYDYKCDENGMILDDTVEQVGVETNIYVILENQKSIGFSDDEDVAKEELYDI